MSVGWMPCIALQHLIAQCPTPYTHTIFCLRCRWVPWSRSIVRRLVACTNISRSAHLSRQPYQVPNHCTCSCSQGGCESLLYSAAHHQDGHVHSRTLKMLPVSTSHWGYCSLRASSCMQA